MITASHIRAARAAVGESQGAFGARFGVDQGTISRWETRGPPTAAYVQVGIAGVLDDLQRLAEDAHRPPQLGNSCFEGGAGEAAAGHDASLADGSPAVTANGAGGFA